MVAEAIVTPAGSIPIPLESMALLKKLGKAIDDRARVIQRYERYYDGEQRLAFATSKFREAFGGLFGAFADNLCDLVVDAVEERLDIEGFRIGVGESLGRMGRPALKGTDKDGDDAAWAMWQNNQLDAYSQIAHTEALVKGISYVCVGPGRKDPKEPEMTVESPYSTIVAYEKGSYLVRRVALKRWTDDDGYLNATLYFPDRLEKFISSTKVQTGSGSDLSEASWRVRETDGEDWPLPHALGAVPIVPIINRPRLDGTGRSEIKNVIPIQDAINKLVMDMIVASEFTAFRQRWATGIEVEVDEVTGEPTEQFKSALDRVWASENENAKFGTLEASNLQPFVAGVEMLIQHVASETRTPYHYFLQHGGQPPSGESLRASEAGLTFKAKRKQRYFGESWEEVIRLGFMVKGDTKRGQNLASETIWADPETRGESEHIDALVKLGSMGVPAEQLWADASYTPQQIARFLEMREREPKVELVKPIEKTAPAMITTGPGTGTLPTGKAQGGGY